ncbi:MAG: helix-turn-helix domain-containing protein [Halobacteriaceae archaeon]
MAADPTGSEEPDLDAVLAALDDADCREILRRLEEPMTASEISETTGIPLSTTYRKLDRLSEATMVAERTEIRSDGHHTSLYYLDFEAVAVALEEDRSFAVDISRPARSPDERLAGIWSEVRKEI